LHSRLHFSPADAAESPPAFNEEAFLVQGPAAGGQEPAISHLGTEERGFDGEVDEDEIIADLGGVEGEEMAETGGGLGEGEEGGGTWQEADDSEEELGGDTGQGRRAGRGL
jgi:hypothetical protein